MKMILLRTMGDSTRELSFLFILLGVSAIFYATLIYLIEHNVSNDYIDSLCIHSTFMHM